MNLIYALIFFNISLIVLPLLLSLIIDFRDKNELNYLIVLLIPATSILFIRLLSFLISDMTNIFFIYLIVLSLITLITVIFPKKTNKQLKVNQSFLLLLLFQVLIFNLFVIWAYLQTNGSFLLGYNMNNDPINHAFNTYEIVNSLIDLNSSYPSATYPRGFYYLTTLFYMMSGADIPTLNFIVALFLLSYCIFPVFYFYTELFVLKRYVVVFSAITAASYLNLTILFMGSYTQIALTPFLIGSIILVYSIAQKPSRNKILSLALILYAGLEVYSFTIIYYVGFITLLFAIFNIKYLLMITRRLGSFWKEILFLCSIISIPLIPAMMFLLSVAGKSASGGSAILQNSRGNLFDHLPLVEVFGLWPFNHYRLSYSFDLNEKKLVYLISIILLLVLFRYLLTIFNFSFISNMNYSKKFILAISCCFLFIDLVSRHYFNSPYLLSKHYQFASSIMVALVFGIFLTSYKAVNTIQKTIISIFLVVVVGIQAESIKKSLLTVDYFTIGHRNSIIKLSNKYESNVVQYRGTVEWMLYYFRSKGFYSSSTRYNTSRIAFHTKNPEIEIFDDKQKSSISPERRIVYSDPYFTVIENKQ